jgi:hypothetical protein
LLVVELVSPAVNLVGFEHEPQNIEQQLETERLIRAIQTPENFFAVPIGCLLDAIDFESPFSGADDFSRGEPEGEEHHEERESEHAEHHEGEHEEHDDEHKESHQDIHVTYEWQCSENKLTRIDVNLFKLYSGFEKIQTQWVVSGKQGAKLLTPKDVSLRF